MDKKPKKLNSTKESVQKNQVLTIEQQAMAKLEKQTKLGALIDDVQDLKEAKGDLKAAEEALSEKENALNEAQKALSEAKDDLKAAQKGLRKAEDRELEAIRQEIRASIVKKHSDTSIIID